MQTRESSWQLFEETNKAFALGIDSREAFFGLFQDNFFRALEKRCPDSARLAAAKRHFLGLLRTRYTPEFVPGMADVVRSLAARFTLVVLSTNTTETIRRVLTEAGLAHCFAHVFAGDVEPDKSVSMRRFLGDAGYRLGRRCSPAYDEGGPSRFEAGDEVLLITDTVGDVKEAAAAGVRAIGVSWGMHGERELHAAGAERVALWPQELCAWILPEADDGCSGGKCTCAREASLTSSALTPSSLTSSSLTSSSTSSSLTSSLATSYQDTSALRASSLRERPPQAFSSGAHSPDASHSNGHPSNGHPSNGYVSNASPSKASPLTSSAARGLVLAAARIRAGRRPRSAVVQTEGPARPPMPARPPIDAQLLVTLGRLRRRHPEASSVNQQHSGFQKKGSMT